MLHPQRAGAFDEPVHGRAVERAEPPVAVGAREACQQFEIHPLREAPEGAVLDGVLRLVERTRPQVFGNDAKDLRADVDAVEAVDVEAIEDGRGQWHSGRFVSG